MYIYIFETPLIPTAPSFDKATDDRVPIPNICDSHFRELEGDRVEGDRKRRGRQRLLPGAKENDFVPSSSPFTRQIHREKGR